MRFTLTILNLFMFLFVASFSNAQETQDVERIIIVTPSDCLLLEQHIPDDDVNYKPDVDVRGNPTVPAEVKNTNNMRIGENGYSFYLTHDALGNDEFKKQYGLDTAQEGRIILGQVSVKEGEVYWNGEPLQNRYRHNIYLLCDEEQRRKRRPIIKR